MTTLFLVLTLIFPRLSLFFHWMADSIPANDTPFWADVLGTLMVPRLLVAYWMFVGDYGIHEIWLPLYVIMGFLALFGSGSKASSYRNRTTTHRYG